MQEMRAIVIDDLVAWTSVNLLVSQFEQRKSNGKLFSPIFRLHRMHEIQAIVSDVRGVCLSVCHAAELGGACSVCRVVRCSRCQITLAFCC